MDKEGELIEPHIQRFFKERRGLLHKSGWKYKKKKHTSKCTFEHPELWEEARVLKKEERRKKSQGRKQNLEQSPQEQEEWNGDAAGEL